MAFSHCRRSIPCQHQQQLAVTQVRRQWQPSVTVQWWMERQFRFAALITVTHYSPPSLPPFLSHHVCCCCHSVPGKLSPKTRRLSTEQYGMTLTCKHRSMSIARLKRLMKYMHRHIRSTIIYRPSHSTRRATQINRMDERVSRMARIVISCMRRKRSRVSLSPCIPFWCIAIVFVRTSVPKQQKLLPTKWHGDHDDNAKKLIMIRAF